MFAHAPKGTHYLPQTNITKTSLALADKRGFLWQGEIKEDAGVKFWCGVEPTKAFLPAKYFALRLNIKRRHDNSSFSVWFISSLGKSKPCKTLFRFSLLLITYKSQKASLVKSEEVISKPQRPTPLGLWQRYKDSNLNKRSQSPVCYRYTIPLYAASSYYCPLTNILYPIITVCQAKIKKIFWKHVCVTMMCDKKGK